MKNVIKKLQDNNFKAYFVENIEEAKELALSLIPKDAVIGMGNSLTLRQTGIFDELTSGNYNVLNQFKEGLTPEENLKLRKQSLLADVYLSGVNAITEDGELINIDGKGNRIAAMAFGPDRVIIVAGKNKIVTNEEEAWERLKKYTAPALAARLGRNTPCAKTLQCSDCNSPQRICRYYSIIRSQMPADADRTHIIIVNEDLGI